MVLIMNTCNVDVSRLPISDKEFLDEIFEASTFSSRIAFDEIFLWKRTLKEGILSVSRQIKTPEMLHKVHLFLIPKMYEQWNHFLMSSMENCGSIKLFMRMIEWDMEFTVENFTQLFTQVKFCEAKTLDDQKLVDQCMDMILKSSLVTDYEVYGREINYPWLILNQTKNLKFVIDLMKAYPACSHYGGISITELMRTHRLLLPWNDTTATQYHAFLQELFNTKAVNDYVSNLNTIYEAMDHKSYTSFEELQLRWNWIFKKIQQILKHYLDNVKFDNDYTHICTISMKIQKEILLRVRSEILDLNENYARLYKTLCCFTNPTLPQVQLLEKYDNLQRGVDILSTFHVWGPFPSETINNICHRKPIRVYDLFIKTCPLSDLSHLSGFDQFKSLSPETTTDLNRVVAYIEQDFGKIDEEEEESQKMIFVFTKECRINFGHHGETSINKYY